jgi:hypothetical protein
VPSVPRSGTCCCASPPHVEQTSAVAGRLTSRRKDVQHRPRTQDPVPLRSRSDPILFAEAECAGYFETYHLRARMHAMTRATTLHRLGRLAEDQWGLVTRRQAETLAGVAPATFARQIRDGAVLERVAHGVYRLTGAPLPDHLELRAAWLQLAPETPAWERRAEQGVVSHRSAAALYGLGHLPADRHEFTLPLRRQTRRPDVRLHQRRLEDREWIDLRGLLVTRPSRIASDLLHDREDPEAVAQLMTDAIRAVHDYPVAIPPPRAPPPGARAPPPARPPRPPPPPRRGGPGPPWAASRTRSSTGPRRSSRAIPPPRATCSRTRSRSAGSSGRTARWCSRRSCTRSSATTPALGR